MLLSPTLYRSQSGKRSGKLQLQTVQFSGGRAVARNLHLLEDLTVLVDNANGGLFYRYIQSGILLHAASPSLMLVAASHRPRSTISSRRSTYRRPSLEVGRKPNTPSEPRVVEFLDVLEEIRPRSTESVFFQKIFATKSVKLFNGAKNSSAIYA